MSDTPVSDLVERLMDDGASQETILFAARELESRVTSRVTTPLRSRAAIKQAEYRARVKERNKINTVAKANDVAICVDEAGNAAGNAVTAHNDLSSVSKKVLTKEEKKETVRVETARGRRFDPEWPLTPTDAAFARQMGIASPQALWDEFRDYWVGVPGQRGCKTDWRATWRNWVRRNSKVKAPTKSNVLDAFDRLEEKMNEWERRDEPKLLT